MSESTQPIPRAALIHAGGSFTVERFEPGQARARLDHLSQKPVRIRPTPGFDAVRFDLGDAANTRRAHSQARQLDLAGSKGAAHGRERLARIVEGCDAEAASALRQPLAAQAAAVPAGGAMAHLAPEHVQAHGYDLDALLFVAVQKSDLAAASFYLGQGADPLRPSGEDGDSAAAMGLRGPAFNDLGWLRLFADHLDIDLGTGGTALHRSVDLDRPDVCQALVEAGADLEARDEDEMTPLALAAEANAAAVCRVLVGAGADLEAMETDRYTPAALAHIHGHDELCAYLRLAESKQRARVLEDKLPPAEDWAPSADGGKELGKRLHGQEPAGEQPVRTRRAGWRL